MRNKNSIVYGPGLCDSFIYMVWLKESMVTKAESHKWTSSGKILYAPSFYMH